jgi:hypothetical protein
VKQAKHQDGYSSRKKKEVVDDAPPAAKKEGELFSFKSNNMQFFKADGMREATGYGEPKDWYFVIIKELLDNAIDWLRDNYRGSADTRLLLHL